MQTKLCNKCNVVKDITDFPKDKHGKFGVRSECKLCKNIRHNNYLKLNPDKLSIYRKTDAMNNPISHWCRGVIQSHRRSGYIIKFTAKELSTFVLNTPVCNYCGCKLSHDVPYGERGLIPKTNHPTLDRINNESVLTLDNVEIICWKCNSTKLNRTKEEFYEYCRGIYMKLKQDYEVQLCV